MVLLSDAVNHENDCVVPTINAPHATSTSCRANSFKLFFTEVLGSIELHIGAAIPYVYVSYSSVFIHCDIVEGVYKLTENRSLYILIQMYHKTNKTQSN